ncbi:MAG TPA: hypothetical protein VOA87_15555 [Thermoanaerobaculia bacterium]|nr:hypothetical protein [Thermoanaerobaculia bacterium]
MNRQPHTPFTRWLAAEGEEREAEAEEALIELFGALERPAPSAAFAERVMLAAAPLGADLRVPLAAAWGRLALALGLVASALSLPLASATLRALIVRVSLAELAAVPIRLLAELGGWLAEGAGLWRHLQAFHRTLQIPLETPAVAIAVGGCLLVSAIAFRFLHDLVERERSWSYVDSIQRP